MTENTISLVPNKLVYRLPPSFSNTSNFFPEKALCNNIVHSFCVPQVKALCTDFHATYFTY